MDRRATAAVVFALLLLPRTQAAADPKGDWAAVRRLKVGTEVVLRTASELDAFGFLAWVDEEQITILDFRRSSLVARDVGVVVDAYARKGVESMVLDGTPLDIATLARTFPRREILSVRHPGGPGPGAFGAAAGAFLGLMGGFSLGAQFPRSGDGDDPGLQNAILGGAIGLPAGAVAGYKLATSGKGIVYQAPAPQPARRQGFRFGP